MSSTTVSVFIRQIDIDKFQSRDSTNSICYEDTNSCFRSFDAVVIEVFGNQIRSDMSVEDRSEDIDTSAEWVEVTVTYTDEGFWKVDLVQNKSPCYDGATPSVALNERLSLSDSPIDRYTKP